MLSLIKYLFVLQVFAVGTTAPAEPIEFRCINRLFLKKEIHLRLEDNQWSVVDSNQSECPLDVVIPKKNSWLWFDADTDASTYCSANTKLRTRPKRQIMYIALSKSLQNHEDGYAQIEVDNSFAEYGTETIKTVLDCRK